jgi:tubulin-specific chaperone A
MSSADIVRQLKIKTNSLKRLHKELSYYEKERDREAGRVNQLKQDNADPHDLRQAVSGRSARATTRRDCAPRAGGSRRARVNGCRPWPRLPQENVLKESEMMMPDTRQRLAAVLADLQSYLVRWQLAPRAGVAVRLPAPPPRAPSRAGRSPRRLLPRSGCCRAGAAALRPPRSLPLARAQAENEQDLPAGEELEAAKQAVAEVEPLLQS